MCLVYEKTYTDKPCTATNHLECHVKSLNGKKKEAFVKKMLVYTVLLRNQICPKSLFFLLDPWPCLLLPCPPPSAILARFAVHCLSLQWNGWQCTGQNSLHIMYLSLFCTGIAGTVQVPVVHCFLAILGQGKLFIYLKYFLFLQRFHQQGPISFSLF